MREYKHVYVIPSSHRDQIKAERDEAIRLLLSWFPEDTRPHDELVSPQWDAPRPEHDMTLWLDTLLFLKRFREVAEEVTE